MRHNRDIQMLEESVDLPLIGTKRSHEEAFGAGSKPKNEGPAGGVKRSNPDGKSSKEHTPG